ncbi:hypothetical protein AN960_12395 [Bacillus sp. FJAT-25509]|uniref:hypothetical protein n=1 Tax=Bacillus sp. FJAT-25509 TaxID=1712029 RepID=UPI0006FA6C68|nr:hypothetical protein [Bacillus sp. FJAT-25509]KQL38773.1 hypothetical protein AN960_12395 [Bacillus sp. FJAT-25509]
MIKNIIDTGAYIPFIFGGFFVILGILFNKSKHDVIKKGNKKGREGSSILVELVYIIIRFLPWHIVKVITILFGLFFIWLAIMTI